MTFVRVGDELGTMTPVVRIVRINGTEHRTQTMRFVPAKTYDGRGEYVDDAFLLARVQPQDHEQLESSNQAEGDV